ncbi:MAG: mandelate racemase/muconate lactonizing enzyme family protein [Chloroflexota bacterium]
MKVTQVETLSCEGGWRIHNFVKISTDEGLVGYSECTMMHSAPMLTAAITHLGSYVIGQDPMNTEAIQLMLYGITQRQIGGLAHQAISGLDAALLDIKGKALGVPVYQLFGGPVRDRIKVYFTHCGREKPQRPGLPPALSAKDIPAVWASVKSCGFTAIKTNPGPDATRTSESDEPGDISNATLDHIVAWIGAWRDALGPNIGIALDVAFLYKMGAILKLARALEPFRMMWLESESLDPAALRTVKLSTSTPICIGESFYRTQGFKPYLEQHALDIIMPDTVWNGITMGKKVADYANTYDIMFAPHNSHGALGGLQAVNLCATLGNFCILEYEYDDMPWRDEIVTHPLVVEDGAVRIPTRPGLGSDINEEAIRAHPPKVWRA